MCGRNFNKANRNILYLEYFTLWLLLFNIIELWRRFLLGSTLESKKGTSVHEFGHVVNSWIYYFAAICHILSPVHSFSCLWAVSFHPFLQASRPCLLLNSVPWSMATLLVFLRMIIILCLYWLFPVL